MLAVSPLISTQQQLFVVNFRSLSTIVIDATKSSAHILAKFAAEFDAMKRSVGSNEKAQKQLFESFNKYTYCCARYCRLIDDSVRL